ncbi:MAG: hypothetical protein ACLUKN_14025 [Bacilli bacterium]
MSYFGGNELRPVIYGEKVSGLRVMNCMWQKPFGSAESVILKDWRLHIYLILRRLRFFSAIVPSRIKLLFIVEKPRHIRSYIYFLIKYRKLLEIL